MFSGYSFASKQVYPFGSIFDKHPSPPPDFHHSRTSCLCDKHPTGRQCRCRLCGASSSSSPFPSPAPLLPPSQCISGFQCVFLPLLSFSFSSSSSAFFSLCMHAQVVVVGLWGWEIEKKNLALTLLPKFFFGDVGLCRLYRPTERTSERTTGARE